MFCLSALLAKHGVQALFSDSEGGVSSHTFNSLNLGDGLGDAAVNVTQNIQRLMRSSNMPMPHQAKQVHETQVLRCQGEGLHHDVEADVLLTNQTGVALAVRTADCLPILIADPKAGIVAAVHAGWRGSVAKVAEVAVLAMIAMGGRPRDMIASLGPCIKSCCFEINAEIAAQLADSCGTDVSEQRSGLLYADLAKANMLQLKQLGLLDKHIEVCRQCTACATSPRYFSFRRDHGETGRQLAIIHLSQVAQLPHPF